MTRERRETTPEECRKIMAGYPDEHNQRQKIEDQIREMEKRATPTREP